MFYIYDDCNIFAGNRTHWSSTGRNGFTAVRKTNTKKEKTSCRSNDKHKIQRRYEGSNICSICHDYGNFCQVKVTLLHKIFVAKYIFIFNRVLCCKNWKNETLIGITKMDFNKAPFLKFLGKFGLFCFCNYLKDALCYSRSAFYRYLSLAVMVGHATRETRLQS